MSYEQPHWATELQSGDRVTATLRHETDSSLNRHDVSVIVVSVHEDYIVGYAQNVIGTINIPFNELNKPSKLSEPFNVERGAQGMKWVKASDIFPDAKLRYIICRLPNGSNKEYRFVISYHPTKGWDIDELIKEGLEWLDESSTQTTKVNLDDCRILSEHIRRYATMGDGAVFLRDWFMGLEEKPIPFNKFNIPLPANNSVERGEGDANEKLIVFAEWLGQGFEKIANGMWTCFADDYCGMYNVSLDEEYDIKYLIKLFYYHYYNN